MITCSQYDILRVSGEPYILLDVRNQDEFDSGHMDGAIHIPLNLLPSVYLEKFPDKDTKIITCCFHGGRASKATKFLLENGYCNVFVLDGGYAGYCRK